MSRRWWLAVVLSLVATACSGGHDARPAASAASVSSSAVSPSSSSTAAPAGATADWTTWGHGAERSGVTSDGPGAPGLHVAWTSSVLDGDVYAQPLVVGGAVIVATENNSVYAFDAITGHLRWQQLKLGAPVAASSLPCGNVDPVGITSTPVADAEGNRLYVVGMVQPMHHELFALALETGAVAFHRTIDAAGSDPTTQNQRGALALANGKVYIPFGGRFGDCGNYRGRIVAVSASGSGDQTAYAVRADRQGGFWAPPGPAVANDGTLFVASGNSDGRDAFDDGNAVIHLTGDLLQTDEFAPADWAQLNATDGDVGTTTPALLDQQQIVQIGKSGVGYVLDAAHLGGVGGALHQGKVCDRVMGGLAHDASTVFVPCTNAVKALTVTAAGFTEAWSVPINNPGPPIVAAELVWVLDVGSGTLHALDRQTGDEVFTATVGSVTHFSAPSAGDHTVFVAAARKVEAFNQSTGGTVTP